MLLTAENIFKNYGTKQLLNDVSLFIDEGTKVGLVGINGAGKSTFLRLLSQKEFPDEGKITLYPNVKISYLEQQPVFAENSRVLEAALFGFDERFVNENEYEAKSLLTRFALNDFNMPVSSLSGGQRKRLALVRTLITPCDVLLLDEPTNHLDVQMILWLQDYLCRFKGGVVMITHDRYFLERVSNRIAELSEAKLYFYEANYSKYLELKTKRAESLMATERKRQAVLRREYEWIMRGAKARGTKSKERIERYDSLKSLSAPEEESSVKISAAYSRLGKRIIEIENISKSFNGRTVIKDFSYNVLRNDRIGVVGKNGVGKSTLLNIISGRLSADSGSVNIGDTVKIGYFTQGSNELNGEQRVFDAVKAVASSIKTSEGYMSASQMLEQFLFPAVLQSSYIKDLSGGEKRRLYLLMILMSAPNVLLLDEPTNDLDVETLAVLEDYLNTFQGVVISVSHDRWFLNKTASQIFEIEDGGIITRYLGGYDEYFLQKKQPYVQEKQAKKAEKYVNKREKKLKFTFAEQREFETIDDKIEEVANKTEEVKKQISLAATDYLKLEELTKKLEELKKTEEELTERWVYLNELYEKICEAENSEK